MQPDTLAINLQRPYYPRVKLFTPENGETVPDEEARIENINKYSMQTVDRFERQLILRVGTVTLPKRLLSENIAPPTIECKNKAQSIISKLYRDFSISPIRISASIEEGIFIKYTNYINQQELSIEIYNDLNVAAILTKNNETITSRDIYDESFSEIYKIFYST